jgi:hypothetical protein
MDAPVLLLRIGLIATVVCLASAAARRGGHVLAGLVTGMPVIVGPIVALLLLEHEPAHVRRIALVTLQCLPATLLHAVAFAWLSRRCAWPVCLAGASAAYLAAGSALAAWALPPWAALALACASPWLAGRLLPVMPAPTGPVAIPAIEVAFRAGAAAVLGGAIIVSAQSLPASVSGLLMAVPIAGSVLPCFTLRNFGTAATVGLLRGFARGLVAFCMYFVVLYLGLGAWPPGAAFAAALAAAAAWGAWSSRAWRG